MSADEEFDELYRWFLRHPHGETLWQEARERVAIAHRIAQVAEVPEREAELAFMARDLGKVLWPAWLFERRLDDADRFVLTSHVEDGIQLLERVPGFLAHTRVLQAVSEHHERYDGGGYPRQVRGGSLSRLSLVTAVSDAVAAMLRTRPWAQALPPERIIKIVAEEAGHQFHPQAGTWVREALGGRA